MTNNVPIYKKYAKSFPQNWSDPTSKLKPSDLSKPSINLVADDYPKIVEFNNMADNTSQLNSTVDIDSPLFQPSPKIIVFEDYKPFAPIEKKLFFRNCDSVGRRIKVLKPDSPFFEVSAPKNLAGEPLKQSKIAPGMEVCYILTFRPQEVREYALELVCCTERENFIVPIRAVGLRPRLTLPDEIEFGNCPIKITTRKNLLIQNIGNSVAKFVARSSVAEFTCPSEEISIEAGNSQNLQLFFTPGDSQPCFGELEIEFIKGVKCYIQLSGIGENVEVSLSTPTLALEPSYISMISQKTVRIRNSSDMPINYSWKSFANLDEEDMERQRLLMELNRMEEIEMQELQQRIVDGLYSNGNDDVEYDADDVFDENGVIPFAAKADKSSLVRKYRNLRTALSKDSMQFVDDIFEISPIEGQVWAHAEIEITVSFRPDTAAMYNCLGFLDVSGRHDRLPLHMSGQGIGPHAALSFDILDIGDVFINDEQFYDVSIKNKGDIPAQWTFLSSLTRFGNKFQFSPVEGYLLPSQTQKINIRFESDVLGEFSEHFRFALQGNEDMLLCHIKGRVIGPTFHFDSSKIDFGTVSFDYLHSTSLKLVNTSRIPMVYNLHIPQDGTYLKKEFNIEPSRGTLAPKESIDLELEFIPSTVKNYDYSLAVDVLGVGDNLLSIPISADCVISTVSLESREIDFGDCFIRYPYEKEIRLTNMSALVHTKFEILPQLKQTKSVGTFETEPTIAVIEPSDSMGVIIRLVTQKLGPYKIPMMISIAGSTEPPIQAVLCYNTIGPKVTVGATELRWGNIECLKDSVRTLTINNEGLITASMKIFLKMARSCYRINVRELVLEAGESFDLEIIANLDDNIVHKDEIHLVVEEGDNLMVPINAKGIGTTMYCKHDNSVMDLGVQLTNNQFEKQIVLENKGRRPQQLKWTNQTLKLENADRLLKAKKYGKDATKLPKHLMPADPVFVVQPEEITLRPRTATTFTFRGFSNIPKSVSEIFILESKVGKDRYMKQIIETEVKCDIVNPLLAFSQPDLSYLFIWKKDVESVVQKQQLMLTNNSAIVLSFVLKTEIPFNLNCWEQTLQPHESVEITVEFDPLYRDNQTSHVVDKSLLITYIGHPQKDQIPLHGEVVFPNLKFDYDIINFGCVLNETMKTFKVKATNWSKIDVNYEWTFFEQTTSKARRGTNNLVPPNQIFDILPIRSKILPGQSEDIEFSMFGNTNSKLAGTVICIVEGGPEYKFPISGEASSVSFELNKSIIDFGKVIFTDKCDSELVIANNGKVNFNYSIEPMTVSGSELLEIIPSSGKVLAGGNGKVIVRIRPGLPTAVVDSISIQIAHFEPIVIKCYCQGIFPSAVVSLPRHKKIGPFGETENVNSALWDTFQAQALNNIIMPDSTLLPPPANAIPPPASGSSAQPQDYSAHVSINAGTVEEIENTSVSIMSHTAKSVSPIAIEAEMQRTALCHLLSELLKNKTEEVKELSPNTPRLGVQAFIAKHIDVKAIVAANYICEFGNVIMGQTKKKIFKISNASLVGQLNWMFDKKHFGASGYSIEPEKVTKMIESSTIDFTAKFFARMQGKVGPKTVVVPLENKGSPTINIILSANVCIPEIDLSSSIVDFSRLLIGKSMKMYVRLTNTSPVTANWSLRKGGKDDGVMSRFSIVPSEGSLRAGKKIIVCVEFAPTEVRKVTSELLLKIESNKKPPKVLTITGEGFGCPLKFDPHTIELGPVFPYFEGSEGVVTVTNASEVPIEFFSTDFDSIYKEEEAMLSAIHDYDDHGVFRTSLRVPGTPLPKEILDAFAQANASNNTKNESDSVTNVENNASNKYEDAPVRIKGAPRDDNLHQDFIFIGPPKCGVTGAAKLLANKLMINCKTIDDIIEEIAMTNTVDLAFIARKITNNVNAEEAEKQQEVEAELSAKADSSKNEAVEAYKKEKKGKAKEIPPEVYLTPEVTAYEEYLESIAISAKNLAKLIQFRVSWVDAGYGVIIDSVKSKYFDEKSVFEALSIAIPKGIYTHITVNGGEEGYINWIVHLNEVKVTESEKLKKGLEGNLKLGSKTIKTMKNANSPEIQQFNEKINAMLTDLNVFPDEHVPSGDESWINSQTGLINELEAQDFKALDDSEKVVYLKQLIYFQYSSLAKINEVLNQLANIWTAESGLKIRNEENPYFCYSDYVNTILPILQSINTDEGSAPIISDAKDENTVDVVSDQVTQAKEYGLFDIIIEAGESEDTVLNSILALLPPPKAVFDKEALPSPIEYQIYHKPIPRPHRKAIRNFEILPMLAEPIATNTEQTATITAPAPASKKGTKEEAAVVTTPVIQETKQVPITYRWLLEPHGSVQFRVKFKSTAEGKFESSLEFEVVETHQKYNLFCSGICELPKINNDTRNIFMKRVKAISHNPNAVLPQRKYIINDNLYSFGPLLLFKKPEWKKEDSAGLNDQDLENRKLLESTNMDTIRISNNGRYACDVELGLENADEESNDVFSIEPKKLALEEGESKDIKIYALPRAVKEYKNNLIISVVNNPHPLEYQLKCWGVEPTLEINGPWGEALQAAETAVAQCTDKKIIKDLELKLASLKEALTLDFDRILIGRTDTRSFTIKNTCLLPIAWEIDLLDFKGSSNVSVSPMSGVLNINESLPIVVSFTSPEAQMLTGKFVLRYSDNENGLSSQNRVVSTTFRAVAEAYKIQAVSLTAAGQESGGTELDFGLLRVGDYAYQNLKMGNKGKYKIGYSFKISSVAMQNLVQIEPMEGLIEAGNALADIKFTFCAKAGELLLKGNKDIIVQILEPTTQEVVEKFPLFISAQAKYNRFRMQPSKGVSFGAVRFDSEAKTKRVEIRNEGSFEMAYVVCPAIAEHDEIDSLDLPAFSCYAYATPAGIRSDELGEHYKDRLQQNAGAGGKGGKPAKDAKPAAKGKGAAEAPTSTLNPLVEDPDGLALGPVPTDPLVVGAFTIFPRVGIIQPGQSIGIDMKFDPSGCATVKERLRMCLSGADPQDSLTKVVRSFEMVGESCVPAIVNDDVNSIFEEQEVVSSLLDVTGKKDAESVGKIEKLGIGKVVYAEHEKILAFGPVSCGQSNSRGAIERIRISNPTKIDVKVKFQILSTEEGTEKLKGSAAVDAKKAGGKDAKAPAKGGKGEETTVVEPKAFTVQPDRWEIPPHEHRFVNIYFNPTEIKKYQSIFFAEVDDNGVQTSANPNASAAGKMLTFNLGGSGTLPCISFDKPTERSSTGQLLVNFDTVLLNRSSKKSIVIRNDGVMPATCLFDISGDNDFIFSAKGASVTVNPGEKQEVFVSFSPKQVYENGKRSALIKTTVLNNQFDQYQILLNATAYACDALIDTVINEEEESLGSSMDNHNNNDSESSQNIVKFNDINLATGPGSTSNTIQIRSQSNYPLKFEFQSNDSIGDVVTFSPSVGHLGPNGSREIKVTFSTDKPVELKNITMVCLLKRIEYQSDSNEEEVGLHGVWDNSMKSYRVATPEDVEKIQAADLQLQEYNKLAEIEKAKGKKAKPLGPPPPKCLLELAPKREDDDSDAQYLYEIVQEPANQLVADFTTQQLTVTCAGVADIAKYNCQGNNENIPFKPTFLFQSSIHKFKFTNESNITLPVKWLFDDLKRRGISTAARSSLQSRLGSSYGTTANQTINTIPCPFTIEPQEYNVKPKSDQEFTIKFTPLEVEDFVYSLRGETILTDITNQPSDEGPENTNSSNVRMVIRGTAKRPICHFEIEETPDYLSRRAFNLKNENGLNSPIEATDLKIVELESVGLRTRNTFRFHIINPTNENYEFIWETTGDPSPYWRCVQSAGMIYGGKRIEIAFEYLPEDIHVAEAFFKFKLPVLKLEQLFLFTGKVNEPKVSFSTSKVDFHAVMLGGEGSIETLYLENLEHLPFQFSFDKSSLLQLEGIGNSNVPVLSITPKAGTIPPHGKIPITFHFKPQEEIVYNYNIHCDVNRKPNKLSINFKGEGYAVHPLIQLESSDVDGTSTSTPSTGSKYLLLKPHPHVNYCDFGSIQVLDTMGKTLSVINNGKFNFDYTWDIHTLSSLVTLSGGKLNGTLLKAEEINYKLTFSPNREGPIESNSMISFTIAGKYVYNIVIKGYGILPALRFSFLNHDFNNCFITSVGGNLVIEEKVLLVTNHDAVNNISLECLFHKTNTLWVDCLPTVITPQQTLPISIKFIPRENKAYSFIIPFIVNGSNKMLVTISGKGIAAKLELVNASQRRINFGTVDLHREVLRAVAIVNKSKKALPLQLISQNDSYGNNILFDKNISFTPKNEILLQPKEIYTFQILFSPTKRISSFNEDLMVNYAGCTKKLLTLSGKAQGVEVSFDSDSLPYGIVVLNSAKNKKLVLENTGDISINYQWDENTFGKHFNIHPLSGKILPGNETSFDVTFKPVFVDEDIRQDNIKCIISGLSNPLFITCTGSCIEPSNDNIQSLSFVSLARKNDVKSIKINNPTDKDWYLSPALDGIHWKIHHELKVPAKASIDCTITYYPLTMAGKETPHSGSLFIALPDGTALLYKLSGTAGPPECSSQLNIETPAKTPLTVNLKINNWLNEKQKLDVLVEMKQQPTPATFIIAANSTEIGPNGTKEFPLRFLSHVEGISKAIITFTNPITGEYAFYEITATTTSSQVLETFILESPVRQTARNIITIENPLPRDAIITMGSASKPAEWFTIDSQVIRINELSSFSGNAEGNFEIEYRPLIPTKQPSEHLLTILTKELGLFKYKIIVKATIPLLRSILRFDVPLGTIQTESFVFRSFNNQKCEFQCKVNKSEFFVVQKSLPIEAPSGSYNAWDGQECKLPIVYEPVEIGEVSDTLTLNHPEYGEYICELIATCIAPMPQGPYQMNMNAPMDIKFRNCFITACNWSYTIDHPAFRVTSQNNISINAKTEGKCSVVFEPKEEHLSSVNNGFITAKLFVTCASKAEIPPWVFYLKGKVDLSQPLGGASGAKKK
eukprot:gene4323-6124_t